MSKETAAGSTEHAAFASAYAALNSAQKRAVDTIDGPVMVIAGPGTGKTQILTLRIANILLRSHLTPENVLALTFTESGAQAMRTRLRTFLGSAAYRVPIHTFHGLAQTLIRRYPDAYPRIIGGEVATDLERIDMIEAALQAPEAASLRPLGKPQYYIAKVRSAIQTMKREYITPDDLAAHTAGIEAQLTDTQRVHESGAHKGKVRGEYVKLEKKLTKHRALVSVYRQYEALLRERNRFDFEDMIGDTIHAVANEADIRADLQETYQYVLADEHQDVNGAQNQLLQALCGEQEQPNIFVVGDEKQAIYRFQGASLENFLYFEQQFGATTTIDLRENYRSGQPILDAAHSLIVTDDPELARLRVPLTAATTTEAAVQERHFTHQAIEDEWLLDTIKETLAAGTPAAEIAVIVRTNKLVESIAERLRGADIPVAAVADSDILTQPLTCTIRALLTAAVRPADEAALATVLHGPYWNIPAADIARVLAARRSDRPLAALIADPEMLSACAVSDPEAVHHVATVLARVRAGDGVRPPHQLMAELVSASGLLDHAVVQAPLAASQLVRRLYDEVTSLVQNGAVTTLHTVAAHFDQLEAHGLPLTAPGSKPVGDAVSVMTAHKAKGLEFSHVFAPRLTDARWGGSTPAVHFTLPVAPHINQDLIDPLDDERRLLYVLMTRAKRCLYLSAAETDVAGKVDTPSRFLAEIDGSTKELVDSTAAATSASSTAAITQVARPVPITPAVCRELFLERGFSATSINNYLTSPWEYFYRNLLRLPDVQEPHLLYGTAIHATLEQATRTYTQSGKLPDVATVRQLFATALDALPLKADERTALFTRGVDTVLTYLGHLGERLPASTKEELSLRVTLPSALPELPEIPLSGKLDRLDIAADGSITQVVDYKTGKPRSRNAIEGNTKHDDGGYKRQLVFYALLLDLYDDPRYRCRTMTLSFVEPTEKGVIKEESFVITDDEIDTLTAEIVAAAKDITSGAFLETPCDPNVCSYCHLVDLLQTGRVDETTQS